MRARKVWPLCALWLACAACVVNSARAQDKGKAFDPSMSLEETVAWLGKQLNHSWTQTSAGGRLRRHTLTKVVKAEGCTLSYVSETQSDSGVGEPVNAADQVRELWTVDLSGLDPWMIRSAPQGRVLFTSAGTKRDVIRTSAFNSQPSRTARHNRRTGALTVDEKIAAEVAAGLKHAAELCRK